MKWRVRMRRTLLAAAAVGVLTVAATIPVAVFASPVASDPRSTDERIPWQLAGAVWSECPTVIDAPAGHSIGWSPDLRGGWGIWLFDEETGIGIADEEIVESFPELTEPIRALHDCLDRFPTTPYSEPRALNPTQFELYLAYVVTELAPCLRAHGRTVELSSRRVFANTDYTSWYMEQTGFWEGSGSLDEQLTMWHECPMLPSYLEQPSTDGVSAGLQQAG